MPLAIIQNVSDYHIKYNATDVSTSTATARIFPLPAKEVLTFNFAQLSPLPACFSRTIDQPIARTLIKDVDPSRCELPCCYPSLEEQIELSERAARGLGNAVVGEDDAEEASPRPEEAGVVAPVLRGQRKIM